MTIRVAALLALMALLAAPRGLVLCFGDAGHVQIEAALELVACQSVGEVAQFESTATESCSDTPITCQPLQKSGEPNIVWGFVQTALLPVFPRAIEPPSCPSGVIQFVSSLWLREHRTIVLLV
ncbi:MAG: hypothetical protein IPK00_18350 [Deltaproteobacteria bacterium]|nr:hypothetical protein [Deltaproteobacteria bacterium]